MDTLESKHAKQRASIRWLLSKAFNNRVPEQLRDPFYADHDGNQHLKPQIVVGLGNASIYCQVLANVYSDPNYQSLNHWSILQTLSRKGSPAMEQPAGEPPLTETVLIQTNPLRINAHMSVIEALMILYAKEVTSGDRIHAAINRITGGTPPPGLNYEQLLLLWISHVMAALKRRIDADLAHGIDYVDEMGKKIQTPDIPAPLSDYTQLCDGVCLAYLISFYCPKLLPWTNVRISYLPTVEDSIHNVCLVSNFSQRTLPYSVFHMTPEDITYMRGALKQNLIVLLADLFNLCEIHPANCVCYPGMEQLGDAAEGINRIHPSENLYNEHGIAHRRGFTCQPINPIPDLRSGLDSSPPHSANSGGGGNSGQRPPFQVNRSPSATVIYRHHTPPKEPPQQSQYHGNNGGPAGGNDESGFVVHRSKGITTLSTMHDPLVPARTRQAKEKNNNDSKQEERGDRVAGRPSNWEEQRRPSFAGRRSRRNSFSEESQLTIENFGGSQDQLNMIGQTTDRRSIERERKLSNASNQAPEPAVAIRSTAADARGSIQIGFDSDSEKQDRDTEKTTLRRQGSNASSSNSSGIQHHAAKEQDNDIKRKTATYNPLSTPNASSMASTTTTTWQQQSINAHQYDDSQDINQPLIDDTKLSSIRLKLEEKRRHIEKEKRRIEAQMSKQLQKVGKAAFLQAINKRDKNDTSSLGDDESVLKSQLHESTVAVTAADVRYGSKPERPLSLQDIVSADNTMNNHENKWIKKTPDVELNNNISLEQYQQSIALMNNDLHDIQEDIQKLAEQQNQIHAQTIQAQQLLQAQQIANILNQQYSSQQNITSAYRPLNQNFGSSPHLPMPAMRNQQPQQQQQQQQPPQQQQQPIQYINDTNTRIEDQFASPVPANLSNHQYLNRDQQKHIQQYVQETNHYRDQYEPTQLQQQSIQLQPQQQQMQQQQQQQQQFYLHEATANQQTPPQAAQRRTWAQSTAAPVELSTWSQQAQLHNKFETLTWKSSPSQQQQQPPQQQQQHQQSPAPISGSGGGGGGGFMLHHNGRGNVGTEQDASHLFPVMHSTSGNSLPVNKVPKEPPSDDMMAPQSISFIGDEDEADNVLDPRQSYRKSHHDSDLEVSLGKMNITSGTRTYRIPSPTTRSHQQINSQSFQSIENPPEKGFYISFDNEQQPKRPKPPLRQKRSPKKDKTEDRSGSGSGGESNVVQEQIIKRKLEPTMQQTQVQRLQQQMSQPAPAPQYNNYNNVAPKDPTALIIGSELLENTQDEMEKKKEKIMLLSLQRRQQQEETKVRKEIDAMQRREREQMKEEERAKKKDEQMSRRAQILEQHRLKKAVEEAEREGKTLDRHTAELVMKQQQQQQLLAQQNAPKMRNTPKTLRQRPKTIHVETNSVDLSEASSLGGRSIGSKKGSSTNLTGIGLSSSNSMRRDYYRGSQDSLAIRESPDEYPSTSSTPLGRRGSYKYGKEPSQGMERGRTLSRISSVAKYGGAQAGANFRGRKSNSLMNLCGDSDSGLGRATPPRRAPSPGMGTGSSSRHLPSPSGPGSLPHPSLMSKRRIGGGNGGYDDGASDISSTPSSIMMDYNGPRLYKQPATKSNRGILLNAVEYCVFPGVVNRDAKQKVLEKIARSEAKHFLVLFRDAGCQFRALYSYWPESETVTKLYGTGPTQVDDVMFDKFFKYNSGGKCFAQVHTKHLTVTIDAFTIHNSLWQGKKASNLPSKKDMALVI